MTGTGVSAIARTEVHGVIGTGAKQREVAPEYDGFAAAEDELSPIPRNGRFFIHHDSIAGGDSLPRSKTTAEGTLDVIPTVLVGPVESIDVNAGTFGALGQNVFAARETLAELQIGDYVNVQGTVSAPGWLYADFVTELPEVYVPGASPVFVQGIPSEYSRIDGRIRVGELWVDHGFGIEALTDADAPALGITGTQPVPGGVLLINPDLR